MQPPPPTKTADIYTLITLFMAAAFANPRLLSRHVSLTHFSPKYSRVMSASLHFARGARCNSGSVRKGQTYCTLQVYCCGRRAKTVYCNQKMSLC